MTVIKRCTCCKRPFTQLEWNALQYVGIDRTDEKQARDMRNCPCGSTICIAVSFEDAAFLEAYPPAFRVQRPVFPPELLARFGTIDDLILRYLGDELMN